MSKENAWATASSLLQDVRIPEPRSVSTSTRTSSVRRHAPARHDRDRPACGPTLLFADEPTTALDVTVQAQILDLLGEQRATATCRVVLVTHDLGVVAGHTDEIAVMYGGKLVEKAPTRACSRT
jgi:peptide/nickel transport system ATP-binding protein